MKFNYIALVDGGVQCRCECAKCFSHTAHCVVKKELLYHCMFQGADWRQSVCALQCQASVLECSRENMLPLIAHLIRCCVCFLIFMVSDGCCSRMSCWQQPLHLTYTNIHRKNVRAKWHWLLRVIKSCLLQALGNAAYTYKQSERISNAETSIAANQVSIATATAKGSNLCIKVRPPSTMVSHLVYSLRKKGKSCRMN